MIEEAVNRLPAGIYRVYWQGGGRSVASIFFDAKGRHWIAPANWVAPIELMCYRMRIEHVELVESAFQECDG